MDYVAENHTDPAIASMSLGGSASQALDNAIKGLVDSGVPVSVAAGNSNNDACLYSPARATEVYTVTKKQKTNKQTKKNKQTKNLCNANCVLFPLCKF